MTEPKVFILRTAGTNCDGETKYAVAKAGAEVDLIHVNQWLANPFLIHQYHFFIIAGGFSYGDDLGAGTVLANQLKQKLFEELRRFIRERKLVLGICNGFQALVKLGLLPDIHSAICKEFVLPEAGQSTSRIPHSAIIQEATLTPNDSGKFEARWIYLKKCSNRCVFTQDWYRDPIYLPVAHGEGKFIPVNKKILDSLIANDQVVFRYADANGRPTKKYPWNPNGSTDNIAAVCDPTGRIMGMMPHPERFAELTNHPQWTRKPAQSGTEPADGMFIFLNAVKYIRDSLT